MKKIYIAFLLLSCQFLISQNFVKHAIDDSFGFTRGVQVVDLNSDQNFDVLSLTTDNTPEVACWFGDGNGNFGNKVIIENNLDPTNGDGDDIALLDVNNDGLLDVVAQVKITHQSGIGINYVGWWQNNGDKTFGNFTTIARGGGDSNDILIFDVDNNNFDDIITYSSYSGTATNVIEYFPNNGNGSFDTGKTILDLDANPRSVHSEFLNDDAELDLIVSIHSKILVAFNNADGTFSALSEIDPLLPGANYLTSGKTNNDSEIDIVASAFNSPNLVWYQGDGLGNFSERIVISQNEFTIIEHPYLADMDKDGDNDLVASTFSNNVLSWWKNDGNGNFSSAQVIDNDFTSGYDLKIADINKDNTLDIIATNGEGVFWFENTMTLSVQENDLERNIYIVPNPSAGEFNIINKNSIITGLEIYDTKGSLVYFRKAEDIKVIDFSSKNNGLYYCKVFTNKGQIIIKLLKQ